MKKVKMILNKCKSLSRQLGRSYSYSSSSRSKSAREEIWGDEERQETVLVGSKKRRYTISSKHLNHPLLNALIEEKSSSNQSRPGGGDISVNCEVVLFDHLLWMLDNADPKLTTESLEELAELYAL